MADEVTIDQFEGVQPQADNPTPEPTQPVDNHTQEPTQPAQTPQTHQAEPYYTAEELQKLEFDQLKPDRIPPEVANIYKKFEDDKKKFQADYTRKTQELSRQREELQATNIPRPPQVNVPENVMRSYMQDPQRTFDITENHIRNLQRAKIQARQEGDLDKETKLEGELLNAQDTMRDLDKLNRYYGEYSSYVNNALYGVNMEVRQMIPDFDKKADKLTEFTKKSLGLTQEDVVYWSDPMNHMHAPKGAVARLLKAIDNLYGKEKTFDALKGKEVKTGQKVEGAGSGGHRVDKDAKIKASYDKAKKAGTTEAWAEYFSEKDKL